MISLLRYKNRKLYNTLTKGYNSGLDIVSYLKDGQNVTVLDYTTRADITVKVLMAAGSRQLNEGNIEAGSVLIKYAGAYKSL
jgi:polyhydroxyalkanoate synthesis regulator protein